MSPSPARSELTLALHELAPHARRVVAFGAMASLLVLAPSWYMLEVYDRVVNSRSLTTLLMLTLAVLLLYAVMETLEWVRAETAFAAAAQFESGLTARVFRAGFEASRLGGSVGAVQALHDLRTVRQFLHSPALVAVVELPAALVFLLLIWAMSPWLGTVALAAALLQALVARLNLLGTGETMREANRYNTAAQQFADRMAGSAPLIAALGMGEAVRARWQEMQSKGIGLQAVASRTAARYHSLSKLLQNLVNSALLGLSAWLLLHNTLNGGAGMLVVAGILGGRVLAPLVQIILQWQSVTSAQQAWERLGQLLRAVPAPPRAMPLPAPHGHVRVEQVVAGAPGQTVPILKGLNFGLAPGEICVVMGPSGAGKSSLARVLLGVWPSVSGRVRLDGIAVADSELKTCAAACWCGPACTSTRHSGHGCLMPSGGPP